MKYIIFIMLFMFLFSCESNKLSNEVKMNVILKNKLELILIKDQGIRKLVSQKLSKEKKKELLSEMYITEADIEGNKIYDLFREIDSINLLATEKIIEEYGYPSKSLVGEPANKAIFFVIQHSKKIDQYLPLIRKAARKGDIDKISLAMMEDRNLMYKGMEQIYGTQIKGQANKDGDWIYYLWPIKNIDSVNVLRKNAGFEKSIKEYAKEKGIDFKLYKLNELDNL